MHTYMIKKTLGQLKVKQRIKIKKITAQIPVAAVFYL